MSRFKFAVEFDSDSPEAAASVMRSFAQALEDEYEWDDFEWEDKTAIAQWLTDNRADAFVARVKPGAREAVAFIAKHGPEVSFEAVQHTLGVDGQHIGGIMSSIGFTQREMKAPAPLIERDYGRRVYIIEDEVANRLLDAFERVEDGAAS